MNESNRAFHAHSLKIMTNETNRGGYADRIQKMQGRLNESLKTKTVWALACDDLNTIFTGFIGIGVDDFPDTREIDDLRQELNNALLAYEIDGDAESYVEAFDSVSLQLEADAESYLNG
jgi:hypothetical protein